MLTANRYEMQLEATAAPGSLERGNRKPVNGSVPGRQGLVGVGHCCCKGLAEVRTSHAE